MPLCCVPFQKELLLFACNGIDINVCIYMHGFLLFVHIINVEIGDLTKKVDNIFIFSFSTFNFLFTIFSKLASYSNEKSNHILTWKMPKTDFSFFFLHLENCYISCDHFLYHFFPFPIGEVVVNFLYFSPKTSIMVLMCGAI